MCARLQYKDKTFLNLNTTDNPGKVEFTGNFVKMLLKIEMKADLLV